jgi:hypothetical protein
LLCQEDVFKGLIAMDFGTSNSTVTLYDPGVVEDLTGLAPEQGNPAQGTAADRVDAG